MYIDMWLLASVCVSVMAVIGLPMMLKTFAQWKARQSLQATLNQFYVIANTYTEHGTPEELQTMIEGLEEVMEELQFLERNE